MTAEDQQFSVQALQYPPHHPVSLLDLPNLCLRCHSRRPTIRFYPCTHRVLCEPCAFLYLHCNTNTWPSICPLQVSRNTRHEIQSVYNETTQHFLFFTPALGYCTLRYLQNRLFVAPSGVTWRYNINYIVPEIFTDTIDSIVSIESPEGEPVGSINWGSIPAIRIRHEEPATLVHEGQFVQNLVSRVRLDAGIPNRYPPVEVSNQPNGAPFPFPRTGHQS